MSDLPLDAYLDTAEGAAREAGKLLVHWEGQLRVRSKGRADLVTDADLAAQRTIREVVLDRFPDHGFLAEEGEARSTGQEFRWIVDPLDGTTNYVHGYPFYAVSIALERAGELLVGVVYDPLRDECFRAARGQGAWLAEQALKVSRTGSLADALVVTSFPPGVQRGDEQVEYFLRVLERGQSVRRTGSAALNLAYVTSGRFDAFWATSLYPWDVAAGVLLVNEAGGRCTTLEGQPYHPDSPRLLVSNGTVLHDEIQSLLTA